jgi:hypothetical protein
MMIDMNKGAPNFRGGIYNKINHGFKAQEWYDKIKYIGADNVENGISDARGDGDIV